MSTQDIDYLLGRLAERGLLVVKLAITPEMADAWRADHGTGLDPRLVVLEPRRVVLEPGDLTAQVRARVQSAVAEGSPVAAKEWLVVLGQLQALGVAW